MQYVRFRLSGGWGLWETASRRQTQVDRARILGEPPVHRTDRRTSRMVPCERSGLAGDRCVDLLDAHAEDTGDDLRCLTWQRATGLT